MEDYILFHPTLPGASSVKFELYNLKNCAGRPCPEEAVKKLSEKK
jgi:hypothetical protein